MEEGRKKERREEMKGKRKTQVKEKIIIFSVRENLRMFIGYGKRTTDGAQRAPEEMGMNQCRG